MSSNLENEVQNIESEKAHYKEILQNFKNPKNSENLKILKKVVDDLLGKSKKITALFQNNLPIINAYKFKENLPNDKVLLIYLAITSLV